MTTRASWVARYSWALYDFANTIWSMNIGSLYFTAWLVKCLVLRYGGLPVYRRASHFATGLIIGWAVVAMVASLVLGPWIG